MCILELDVSTKYAKTEQQCPDSLAVNAAYGLLLTVVYSFSKIIKNVYQKV